MAARTTHPEVDQRTCHRADRVVDHVAHSGQTYQRFEEYRMNMNMTAEMKDAEKRLMIERKYTDQLDAACQRLQKKVCALCKAISKLKRSLEAK